LLACIGKLKAQKISCQGFVCIHQVVAIVTHHYGYYLPLLELSVKWLLHLGMEFVYRLGLSKLRTETQENTRLVTVLE